MLFFPLTPAGLDWIVANVQGDAMRVGGAVVVEPRHAPALADGMIDDGLEVS